MLFTWIFWRYLCMVSALRVCCVSPEGGGTSGTMDRRRWRYTGTLDSMPCNVMLYSITQPKSLAYHQHLHFFVIFLNMCWWKILCRLFNLPRRRMRLLRKSIVTKFRWHTFICSVIIRKKQKRIQLLLLCALFGALSIRVPMLLPPVLVWSRSQLVQFGPKHWHSSMIILRI